MELVSLIYILKKIFIINKKEYGLGYLDKRIGLRVGFWLGYWGVADRIQLIHWILNEI